MAVGCVMCISAVAWTGCSKASHNGDLDGQWQVMEVVYGDTSLPHPEEERFYYDFYLSTFQLGYTDKRPEILVGNMDYEGSTLGLELPYVAAGRVGREWIERLPYWGMPTDGKAVMKIKELTGSRLVMQHDTVTIVCRKF